jgi:hypothetical protein
MVTARVVRLARRKGWQNRFLGSLNVYMNQESTGCIIHLGAVFITMRDTSSIVVFVFL